MAFRPPRAYRLHNETPRRLELPTPLGSLVLAPLEDRVVPACCGNDRGHLPFDDRDPEVLKAQAAGILRVEPVTHRNFEVLAYLALGGLLLAGAAWLIDPVFAVVLMAAALVVLGVMAWRLGALRAGLLTAVGDVVKRRLVRSGMLVVAISVSLGLPVLAMYFGTEVQEILRFQDGRLAVASTPAATAVLVGRAMQLGLIALASLLPGVMYFQFGRERLRSIRHRLVRDIFRLDATLKTMADLRSRYGSQVGDVLDGHDNARTLVGRTSPIIVATITITLGWLLILLNSDVRALGQVQAAGAPARDFRPINFLELLTPEASTVTFGFLGAYFFAIQHVLRAYVRGDLKPKAYNTIAVRIFMVVILAWLIDVVGGGQSTPLFVASFFAGVVPETALHWLRGQAPFASDALLDSSAPLDKIEGIDLYDRTRLAEEGITNVQALAHHDLVELMVNTRIPVHRLLDWIDQAILYLHVGEAETANPVEDINVSERLRRFGIRTASDLVRSVEAAKHHGENVDQLLRALAGDSPRRGGIPTMRVVLDVMGDDDWLPNILNWREESARRWGNLRPLANARASNGNGDGQLKPQAGGNAMARTTITSGVPLP